MSYSDMILACFLTLALVNVRVDKNNNFFLIKKIGRTLGHRKNRGYPERVSSGLYLLI